MCVCEGLMRSIISATDRLVEDPEDYEARADLAWSSALALSALTSVGLEGGDWSAHLLEHALSALWPEVPHGAGLAVLFPALLQREEAGTEYARTRFAREVMGAATALEGGVALREKFDEWGAPATLSGLGIPFDENDRIIRHVMRNMESVHAGGKGREAPDEKALAELLEDVR